MTLRHFQIFLYVHDEGGMSHSRDGRALWNEAL